MDALGLMGGLCALVGSGLSPMSSTTVEVAKGTNSNISISPPTGATIALLTWCADSGMSSLQASGLCAKGGTISIFRSATEVYGQVSWTSSKILIERHVNDDYTVNIVFFR